MMELLKALVILFAAGAAAMVVLALTIRARHARSHDIQQVGLLMQVMDRMAILLAGISAACGALYLYIGAVP